MAWFNYLFSILNQTDQALAVFLPDLLRLLLWPALAYTLAWGVYRLGLPREKMKEWQLELLFQNQLRATFRQLGSRWLGNPWRQRRLQFLVHGLRPLVTLLSIVLITWVLLWLPQRFAWRELGPGNSLVLSPQPSDAKHWALARQAQVQPAERAYWSDKLQAWTILWPTAGTLLRFHGADGRTWFELGGSDPGTQIAPAAWWYGFGQTTVLHPAAPFRLISIERRAQYYLPWGPGWMRSWWFPPLALGLLWVLWRLWYRWRKPDHRPFFAKIRPTPDETPAQLALSRKQKQQPKPEPPSLRKS